MSLLSSDPLGGWMETRIPKQRAADLLSTTNLRIKDIVIACGFSSSHQFERAIKKMYGMNPTEFRRQKLRASGAGELS